MEKMKYNMSILKKSKGDSYKSPFIKVALKKGIGEASLITLLKRTFEHNDFNKIIIEPTEE